MAYYLIVYTFIAFLPWVAPTWAADEEANPYAAPNTQERIAPKIPARWELDSSFFDELAARLPADASDEAVYTATRNLLREKFEERNGIRLPDVPNAKALSFEHHRPRITLK